MERKRKIHRFEPSNIVTIQASWSRHAGKQAEIVECLNHGTTIALKIHGVAGLVNFSTEELEQHNTSHS